MIILLQSYTIFNKFIKFNYKEVECALYVTYFKYSDITINYRVWNKTKNEYNKNGYTSMFYIFWSIKLCTFTCKEYTII